MNLVLALLITVAGAAQTQPDFSGRWVLVWSDPASVDAPRVLVVEQPITRTNVRGEPVGPAYIPTDVCGWRSFLRDETRRGRRAYRYIVVNSENEPEAGSRRLQAGSEDPAYFTHVTSDQIFGQFTFSIDTGFRSACARNAGRSTSDLKPM